MKSSKPGKRVFVPGFGVACLLIMVLFSFSAKAAYSRNEIISIPIVLVDYYGWAYAESFLDKSEVYGWSTAGVDALGWGIILTRKEYSGLFLINLAGLAKTVYPVVQLLSSADRDVENRAWIALGTHAATLISLELLGKPALGIQAWTPGRGEYGAELAFKF